MVFIRAPHPLRENEVATHLFPWGYLTGVRILPRGRRGRGLYQATATFLTDLREKLTSAFGEAPGEKVTERNLSGLGGEERGRKIGNSQRHVTPGTSDSYTQLSLKHNIFIWISSPSGCTTKMHTCTAQHNNNNKQLLE